MRRQRPAPYLFLLPFAVLFAAFLVAPLLYAAGLSLYRDTLVGGRTFTGLANYAEVLGDDSFWQGIGNMAVFGIMQIPVMLALALAIALALHGRSVWGRSFFRVAFFVPYAVPGVVAALVWGYLYGPVFGPARPIATALGLPPPNFLAARSMLPSLANIVLWEFTGYNTVILYAALQSVPPEVEEAAAIDGASRFQAAMRIKVPMISGALATTAIFAVVHTLQLFNEPQLMASLAPAVIGDHYTPNLYAYTLAFVNQQLNYSAAVSFTLALLVIGLACAVLALGRVRRPKGTA